MGDAAAVIAAAQQVDLSKLPLYHADAKKDAFTAEEWVERVQRAKDAGTWNDVTTTSYVYNALRQGALTWYRTLKWSNVNNQVWADVKRAFLEAYGTTHTSSTTTTAINELKQNNDSVIVYYTKVVEVMSDLQALLPPGALGVPEVPFPAEIRNLAGFVGLADDIKNNCTIQAVDYGAQRMIYFIATQIFISGLKTELRQEVMKQNPLTIMQACSMAQTQEKIITFKKPNSAGTTTFVTEIKEGEPGDHESEDAIQCQIDELQRRKTWVASRNRNWQGQSGSGSNSGSNGRAGGYSNGNGNGNNGNRTNQPGKSNPAKGKKCHYCGKMNHFQKDCRKRAADKAPMVTPPGRVNENRTDDSDGHQCHPFQGDYQSQDISGIYQSLNY